MKYKNFFVEVLNAAEKNSTCCRLQVAALIVKNDRIISTGWNGVPSGLKHCCDVFDTNDVNFMEDHKHFSEMYEIHAEQNAIAYAARNGIALENCDMYVTYSPCVHCAKIIIASGIKRVFYKIEYDRNTHGIELLKKLNIEIIKI